MEIIETGELTTLQKNALFRLWNDEYPLKLNYKTLQNLKNYLGNLRETRHLLLSDDSAEIKGWAFSFVRDNDRWFAIILSGTIQAKGYGRILLEKLKAGEHKLNAWVIDHNNDKKKNGESYRSPLGFYKKCGFKIIPEVRLDLEIISAVKIEWERE